MTEIYRSEGVTVKVETQEGVNRVLRDALGKVEARGRERWR